MHGWDRRKVLTALRAARAKDFTFTSGEVLGSMCTAPHEIAVEADHQFMETNLGDPGHFPGTAQLEQEVLVDLLELMNAPAGAGGRFVSGGTEANLVACYVAREKTGKRDIVVPDSAHFSFEKAARLLQMRLVHVPTVGHRADPAAMEAAIGPDTALVVAIAGTTELGLIDPIAEVAAACVRKGALLHVDAAYGGYLVPFLDEASRVPVPFDFSIPGVWSLCVDPHKGGMASMPAGVLLLRDLRDWELTAVASPYLSTPTQSTLLGTRPGSPVASAWAVHRHLGRVGFASLAESCMDHTTYLAVRLVELGIELVAAPQLTVVAFYAPDAVALRGRLQEKGWSVNIIPRFGAVRVVVGPHLTRTHIEGFLTALSECMA